MNNKVNSEEYEFESIEVAAFIIDYAKSIDRILNTTQVQKILYCCYGVTLALTEKRLTKEHPQAWPFGPVFPKVFKAISKGNIKSGDGAQLAKELPPELKYRLETTIEFFSGFVATKLSAWTHMPDSPWDKSTEHGTIVPVRMDDLAILKYFRDTVVSEGLNLDSDHSMRTIR